jgi:hypothetical protein
MRIKACERASAAGGQQEDTAGERKNAAPSERAERLANERHAQGGRHERCGSARKRIDLTQIADAITFTQADEIEQMNDDRCDDPRPRRREREADERQQRDTEDARADRNQGRRRKGVASNLDCRIPACMAGGGEQDGREDERIQEAPI